MAGFNKEKMRGMSVGADVKDSDTSPWVKRVQGFLGIEPVGGNSGSNDSTSEAIRRKRDKLKEDSSY